MITKVDAYHKVTKHEVRHGSYCTFLVQAKAMPGDRPAACKQSVSDWTSAIGSATARQHNRESVDRASDLRIQVWEFVLWFRVK